jgi:hypothetical protein
VENVRHKRYGNKQPWKKEQRSEMEKEDGLRRSGEKKKKKKTRLK